MDALKVGDRVSATITKNGYFISSYNGTVTGFTKNNRIKIKSYRGIKIHSSKNVTKIKIPDLG
jgi:hypothetical protein